MYLELPVTPKKGDGPRLVLVLRVGDALLPDGVRFLGSTVKR